ADVGEALRRDGCDLEPTVLSELEPGLHPPIPPGPCRRPNISTTPRPRRYTPRMALDLRAVDIATVGEDVPLLEGVRTTRAIRRLRPDPVPPALIRKVCEAGTFAPSGGNRQPWTFVAVTDPERRAFVAERYRRGFAAYIAPALEEMKRPEFPEAKRR